MLLFNSLFNFCHLFFFSEPTASSSKEPEKAEPRKKVAKDPFAFDDVPTLKDDEIDQKIDDYDDDDDDEDFIPDKVRYVFGTASA